MTALRSRWRWFNLDGPSFKVMGRRVRLWNAFNRHTNDGDHWWGFGVLQVNRRHLFFVAFSGVSVLFIGQTQ